MISRLRMCKIVQAGQESCLEDLWLNRNRTFINEHMKYFAIPLSLLLLFVASEVKGFFLN